MPAVAEFGLDAGFVANDVECATGGGSAAVEQSLSPVDATGLHHLQLRG